MKCFSYTELSELQLEGISGGNAVTAGYTTVPATTSVGSGSAPSHVNIFYGPTTINNINISIINVSNNVINGSLDIGVFQSIEM